MFSWNSRKVKSAMHDPELGRPVIVEMSAKDIVQSPNRHRLESIVSALTICVSELVNIKEEEAARIADFMKQQQPRENKDDKGVQDSVPASN